MALLAKHEKALFWEWVPAKLILCIAVLMFLLGNLKQLPGDGHNILLFGSLYCMIAGVAAELRYRIYRSKVDTLKEVKQVQLQILELQASLNKCGKQGL